MFKFIMVLTLTAILAVNHLNSALMFWTISIAVFHAVEETEGKLWKYFGEIADFNLLKEAGPFWGVPTIVLPALLLQIAASVAAFWFDQVAGLALLIGLRLGDAFFSHLGPLAMGYCSLPQKNGRQQLNPGLPTSLLYLIDGLLLCVVFSHTLATAPMFDIVAGFWLGSLFFAAVLPSLRLLGVFFNRRQ